jgi:uncharacterized Zn finger protein
MASVADLVEPEALREKAGEYLLRAGEVLRAAGSVNIVDFGPTRVTAQVEDGGERHQAALEFAADGLSIRCDCLGGGDQRFCPHTVATAIEAWHRAPERRG